MEVTEATDSGLWEEGIVKDRTMEGGRDPRRSSAGGWNSTDKEKQKEKKNTNQLWVFIYIQGAQVCESDTIHIFLLHLSTVERNGWMVAFATRSRLCQVPVEIRPQCK